MEDEPTQLSDGERYLRILGRESYSDKNIPTEKGLVKGRDFIKVCRPALDALVKLEAMDPQDPDYEITRTDIRDAFDLFAGAESPSQ